MRARPPPLLATLLALAWWCAAAGCPAPCDCLWRSGKETVVCVNANLSAIPRSLDAGTQVLDLTGNAMHAFAQDAFFDAGLANLQKVFAARCALAELHRFAFRRLSNLVELDLSDNALTAVPSHAFPSVPELRELRLAGNALLRVESHAFSALPRLVRLDLSRCGLRALAPDALAGLERTLEWLRLDRNVLTGTRLPELPALHGLALAANPWQCCCDLRPLFLLRRAAPGDAPACAQPPRLAGRPWDRLELDELACAPRVAAAQPAATAVEGRNVTLTCEVRGEPAPRVRWLWRGRELANASARYEVGWWARGSRLTVVAAGPQHAGEYVCAADNAAGRARAAVTLSVLPASAAAAAGAAAWAAALAVPAAAAAAAAGAACALRRGRRRRLRRRADKLELNHAALLDGGAAPPPPQPPQPAPAPAPAPAAAAPAPAAAPPSRPLQASEVPGLPLSCEEVDVEEEGREAPPPPAPAGPESAPAPAPASGPGPDLHIPRRRDADHFPDLLEISPRTLEAAAAAAGARLFGTLPRRRGPDAPCAPGALSFASLPAGAGPYAAASLSMYEQQATQLLRFLAEYRSLRAELTRVQAGLGTAAPAPAPPQPAPPPYWLPRRFSDADFSLS